VEKPHARDLRVETSTKVDSSREGRKYTKGDEKFLDNAWKNVAAPTS
jgi:hypothetical protein